MAAKSAGLASLGNQPTAGFRIKTLATQDGADASGSRGAIGLGQDAQFVLRGERPAARTVR
jgi:hypothetical protein